MAESRRETAQGLARVLPSLGLLITEPLPEPLRDSRSQMILLQLLSQRQAATVSEVATAMGIAVPSASVMVRKMVEKGLLERTQDPEDWRSVRISLSPAGLDLLRGMTERRAKAVEGLIAGLSEDEIATLREATAILERLVPRPAAQGQGNL
ncbi:MAG: MarR family winged helix-turn-helix transcriptional regulator [Bacillota bacterium]